MKINIKNISISHIFFTQLGFLTGSMMAIIISFLLDESLLMSDCIPKLLLNHLVLSAGYCVGMLNNFK